LGVLDGKLALVTGAGTGIGQGIARELGRAGAAVVLHYAHSAAGAEAVVAELRQQGGRALAVQGDFTQFAAYRQVVETAVGFLGGLDILVNNAGVTRTVDFLDTSEELYEELFRINLKSYFFCAQVAVPHIAARGGGSILNITSIHAFGGAPRHTAYAATKGAIVAFTRQLAIELVPQRIRVNAIGPGVIEVPRYFATMPGYRRAIGNSWVPWGRVGLPEDVARVAVFLVSDAAEFTTGQVLYVDGGHTARLAGLGVQPEERSEGGPGSR
jgi:glucose 1-dehydrogenase/3-oxoacyl-[acyl-carrier protein] reductase